MTRSRRPCSLCSHRKPEVKTYGLIGHYQQDPDAYEGVIESWLNSNHLPERRAGVIIAGESGTSKYVNRLEAPS